MKNEGTAETTGGRSRLLCLAALCVFMLAMNLSETGYAAQESAAAPKQNQGGWQSVVAAMGRPGALQPDGVMKFAMPRTDLKVTVAGTEIKPGLALGSWVAFKKIGQQSLVMGDLVLTESEVAGVMVKLQEGGVEVTALHNHLLGESPRVLYMHIGGRGNAAKLATAVHDALALTHTPAPAPSASAAPSQEAPSIDTHQIEQILGRSGKLNHGIFQVSVPRGERIMMGGLEVSPSMGVATALNFQPTGGGQAAITGDFVLLGSEVNPVIKALRENGIAITALHSHMLGEQPRLFFMHFWANDEALKLARGLRAALDKTHSSPSPMK